MKKSLTGATKRQAGKRARPERDVGRDRSPVNSAKQTPYLMKSGLSGAWYIVTRYVEKRGMCAMGPDAGKSFDYLIAKEKFDCTEQMEKILKSELAALAANEKPA